jgi:hypothetical protein
MSNFNQIPKQSWFSLDEEIATIPPVVYSKTAVGVAGLEKHTAQKTSGLEPTIEASQLSKRHKALGGQALVNNSSCHEYLALDLSADRLKDLKEKESNKTSRFTVLSNHRVDSKHGFYPGTLSNPSFMMFPSFWYGIFVKGVVVALLAFMPIILPLAYLIMMFMDSPLVIVKRILFLGTDLDWFFWGYLALIPVNRALDYCEKRDWHRVFDPKEIPLHSAIKRDTGMVRIFNNRKEWADLPFDEFEGFNTLVPMGRGQQTRKLTIRHKGTGFGFLLGEGGVDGWHPALLWEYYQHYMDVTRPLPDVPFFEPYRHLDPTTKKWDEEHNRPSRFWRDMDKKEYEALVQESILVAKKYPYLEPKNISDLGWQSAGDGKHWYQLG